MSESILFPLFLSLKVSIIATCIIAIFGTAITYLLAKRQFLGKNIVDALVTLPLVLPPTVTGYYLIVLLGRNGWIGKYLYAWTGWTIMFTWQAAVIASVVVAMPLMVKTTKSAIESIDPDLEKAAYTLGKSELETALQVTLPMAWTGIIAGIILSFARAICEFGAILLSFA
ncbi:MAG: molybdate ABC transporter permease subunit [Methanosarcinales archaeon]